MLLKYGRYEINTEMVRSFRDSLQFRLFVKRICNFFVQQIDFSSKKTYNWMKKNDIGRREIA